MVMTANRMQITTHRRRPHPWPYEQERFSFCCSSSIYCTVTHAKGILTKQSADQMILPLCLYFIQTTRSRVHSPDGSRREKGQRERERELNKRGWMLLHFAWPAPKVVRTMRVSSRWQWMGNSYISQIGIGGLLAAYRFVLLHSIY
jgi:hypothetical protein